MLTWDRVVTIAEKSIVVAILLWLLGAFEPVSGSPLVRELRAHREESAPVLRGICRGIWRTFPEDVVARECGK